MRTSDQEGIINDQAEALVRTLLYEGYALFPYHRTAVKNQKPVPFGVIYPEVYEKDNVNAPATFQLETILVANESTVLDFEIRFLHLVQISVFQKPDSREPVGQVIINGATYQSGWQTIERKLVFDNNIIAELQEHETSVPFHFPETIEDKVVYDELNGIGIRIRKHIRQIQGGIKFSVKREVSHENDFIIHLQVNNDTDLKDSAGKTRDEILLQSFLSTHVLLHVDEGQFISHQSTPVHWTSAINQCQLKGWWPILLTEDNKTLLASPIIVYDYPQLNSNSPGDFFDSTEIEEALLLHVAVMSDEEKEKIAQSDEKLKAMLTKVSQVTPEEWIEFHGGMKDNTNAS